MCNLKTIINMRWAHIAVSLNGCGTWDRSVKIRSKVWLEKNGKLSFGPGRARILRAVRISQPRGTGAGHVLQTRLEFAPRG